MANEPDSTPVEITITTEDNDSGITVSGVIIGALYVLGIGINIYLIADQASDGALSREVSIRYHHLKGRIVYLVRERREFHKAKGRVVWEAMETVNRKGETNE